MINISSKKPVLFSYFEDTANVILSQYKRAGKLKSSTNIGKNREYFCNNFLKKVLPHRLSITTGEIIDSENNQTGQLDLIINRDTCPALEFGSSNSFLAEGVFAVIEVKSNLNTKKLIEAGESREKVRKMSIKNKSRCLAGPNLNRHLRIVFAYKGATWKTLERATAEGNF